VKKNSWFLIGPSFFQVKLAFDLLEGGSVKQLYAVREALPDLIPLEKHEALKKERDALHWKARALELELESVKGGRS
jgi:hypothetical protein